MQGPKLGPRDLAPVVELLQYWNQVSFVPSYYSQQFCLLTATISTFSTNAQWKWTFLGPSASRTTSRRLHLPASAADANDWQVGEEGVL